MDAWRVAVLGDGGVGKTALAVQFTLNRFIDWYDPTIEDTYRTKLLVDERMCFVEVIDTAGQDEYQILRDQWAREGQGFILVYSIASRQTFDRLDTFHTAMIRAKRHTPIFMLVGNMVDRTQDRQVTREEGYNMARRLGCDFMEASAKTALNVESVFTHVIRNLRATREPLSSPRSPKEKKKRSGKNGPSCIIV